MGRYSREFIEQQPGKTYLQYVNAADVKPEPIRWVWKNVVPDESLTMIAGHGGEGKSTLTMDLAARKSRGRSWPDDRSGTNAPGGVVILNVEDKPAKVTVPRLIAAEAELSRIKIITRKVTIDAEGHDVRRPIDVRCDIDRIAEVVDNTAECKLLIVDPITALIGDIDSNSVTQVRTAMLALSDLAEARRIAVVVVSHLSKGTGSSPALRTLGSVGFTAAARAAWFVVAHPTDRDRRLFLLAKSNYGPKRDGLSFTMSTTPEGVPYILWDAEPATMTIVEAMAAPGRSAPARDAAENWLSDYLADGTPKPSTDVRAAAEAHGFAWDTIRRAQKSLGVIVRKLGMSGGWSWELSTRRGVPRNIYHSSYIDTVLHDSDDSDAHLRRTASKTEGAALTETAPLRFAADQDDSDRLERDAVASVETEAEAADRNGRG